MTAARPAHPLRVALLGCGEVGSHVADQLLHRPAELAARIGAPVELVGVAVRELDKPRRVPVPRALLTRAASALLTDDLDVLVEVIGGIEPARMLALDALRRGSPVVTANQALIAIDGARLQGTAADRHPAVVSRQHRLAQRGASNALCVHAPMVPPEQVQNRYQLSLQTAPAAQQPTFSRPFDESMLGANEQPDDRGRVGV